MKNKLIYLILIFTFITVFSAKFKMTYDKYYSKDGHIVLNDSIESTDNNDSGESDNFSKSMHSEITKDPKIAKTTKSKQKVIQKPATKQDKYIPSTSYVVRGKKYYTLSSDKAKNLVQTGYASWYGPGFHGKKTANGEIYNQNMLTAAHKTLPLNTTVKVTNLENNKTLIVRVNDRGPYHGNRILDLSKEAANQLGVLAKGTAKIKLQVI